MKTKILIILSIVVVVLSTPLLISYGKRKREFKFHETIPKTITLRSNEFEQNGKIPLECTGKGNNTAPSLYWSNLPKGTQSLVLIMTDYDGPAPFLRLKTVEHWLVYNIPANKEGVKKGSTTRELQKENISLGENYTKGIDYAGPNPPIGTHRYYFRIYALSKAELTLTKPKKEVLIESIKGTILGYGELIGTF